MYFDHIDRSVIWRTMLAKLAVPLMAVLLAACAQPPRQADSGKPALSYAEAQTRYQQGLARYRDSNFETALADLDMAVSSGHLKTADAVNARKHMAFIHCVNNREAQCREQFQVILKGDSNFDLAPNEASHPTWGPVWRSVKGVLEDQRAVTRGSSVRASMGEQKLAEGIREYDGGRYKEAVDALQSALANGLSSRADEIRAHKYSAFAYCLSKHGKECRAEFRAIFKLDPGFELLPSEAGHPAWAATYRQERAAAKRPPKK